MLIKRFLHFNESVFSALHLVISIIEKITQSFLAHNFRMIIWKDLTDVTSGVLLEQLETPFTLRHLP